MFVKLIRLVPAPTLIGFIISMFSVLMSVILPLSATTIFLSIIILVCFAWGLQKEYKLPLGNNLMLVGGMLLGHLPYLLIKFIF